MEEIRRSPSLFGIYFSGRISRTHFFFRFMIEISVAVVCVVAIAFFTGVTTGMTTDMATGMRAPNVPELSATQALLLLALAVYLFLHSLSNHVCRLHDLNYSGWLVLLAFIPCVNVLLFLGMVFCPPTDGINAYGDPAV